MNSIRYTLISDGSSDKMLMPVLDWLLREHFQECALQPAWADLGRLQLPPKSLPDRIRTALDLYPCDILFIHRDAEKSTYKERHSQIQKALAGVETPPVICVIPVRMLEAWLLFDEASIRKAAGNLNGRISLSLPAMNSVETHPDPKHFLFDLIRMASGATGRRLKKLEPRKCAFLVAKSITDFSPLRSLNAFRCLEDELKNTLVQLRCTNDSATYMEE